MSNKGKILAALVIWVGVMFFGYRMYERLRPALFGLPRGGAGGARFDRNDWEKIQKEQEEFFTEKVPSGIKIKVKKSKTPFGMDQERTNNGGFYYVANNQLIGEIYARLSGKPRWQVAQVPQEAQRWDVKIKAPESMRGKVADAFLAYMKWTTKTKTIPGEGYHFVASGGTLSATPPQGNNQRNRGNNGMQIPPLPLGTYAENMRYMLNAPITVDADIKDRALAGQGARVQWNVPPDQRAAQIAEAYGVGVKKDSIEMEGTLVYHPKYSSKIEMGKWEQGLLTGR